MHPENILPYLKRGHSLAYQTRDDEVAYGWIAFYYRPANVQLMQLFPENSHIAAREDLKAVQPFQIRIAELKAETWDQDAYHGPDDILHNECVSFSTLEQATVFLSQMGIALTDLVEAHRIKTD